MSQRILCAVDMNAPDQDSGVLMAAKRLATLDGAALDIMTVVPDFGYPIVAGYFDEGHHSKLVTEVKSKLQALSTSVLGDDNDRDARHIVATGTIYQEILNAAGKAGSDLIVIGANSPDLKDFLLGPNAARIVRHAKCSVYVVR